MKSEQSNLPKEDTNSIAFSNQQAVIDAIKSSPNLWGNDAYESDVYLQGLTCPSCRRSKAYISKAKPFAINCGGLKKCKEGPFKTSELFPEIFQSPFQGFDGYTNLNLNPEIGLNFLKSRGLDKSLKGLKFTVEKVNRQNLPEACNAVMFEISNGSKNGRLINPPEGVQKGHNRGGFKGAIWLHQGLKYDENKPVFITESIIDALSLWEADIQAISALSASVTPDDSYRELLSRFNKPVLAFDNDEAGRKALDKWRKIFPSIQAVYPSEGLKDWNDYLKENGKGKLREYIDNQNFDRVKSPFDWAVSTPIDTWLDTEPKPKEYLIEKFLPKVSLGIIGGAGGTGKSYFTLQMAFSIATGIPLLNDPDYKIKEPSGVLIVNAEDQEEDLHIRIKACANWVKEKGYWSDKTSSLLRKNIHLLPSMGKGRFSFGKADKQDEDSKNAIIAEIQRLKSNGVNIKLVILDPVNRLINADSDSNQNNEVARFIQSFEELHHMEKVTVILVHHFNKQTAKDGDLSAFGFTGSSAFIDAPRWALAMLPISEGEGKQLSIEVREIPRFTKAKIVKANYLPAQYKDIKYLRKNDEGVSDWWKPEKQEKESVRNLAIEWLLINEAIGKTKFVEALMTANEHVTKKQASECIEELIEEKVLIYETVKNSGRPSKVPVINPGINGLNKTIFEGIKSRLEEQGIKIQDKYSAWK